MNNQNNWLQYYKNSLFDSENLAVDIERIKSLYTQQNVNLGTALINKNNANELLDAEERRINRIKGVKKDNPKWHEVTDTIILIAPFRLEYQTKNEKFKQRTLYPFWITARVNRSGELSAPKDIFPLIVRNHLAPIADAKNDFIFSSIDLVTSARDIEEPTVEYEEDVIGWDEYWTYVNEVFTEITYLQLQNYKTEGYTTQFELTYFAASSKMSAAKSILFLYEQLMEYEEELPLLNKIIDTDDRLRRPAITDYEYLNYNHLHLGQMSDEFPLSISQRKTLLSYLSTDESPIMAVNGPPGTGKTTLLQSLVATEYVKAAIAGEEAPVIMACSNNNQAVTNIIDSFINSRSSHEELSERWIPNFNGYATYLPSSSKSTKNLKNINYLKGNLFGHEGTLCDLENEDYLYEAEHYFLDRFNAYFDVHTYSIEDACEYLQDQIITIEDTLIDSVNFSNRYIEAIDYINSIVLREEDKITRNVLTVAKIKEWRTQLIALKEEAKALNFKELLLQYFSVDTNYNETQFFKITEQALTDNTSMQGYLKTCIAQLNAAIQTNLQLSNWKREHNIQGYPLTSEAEMWEHEFEKLRTKNHKAQFFYDELDVALRHKAFLLATHYWEARWLLATQEMLEEDTERGTGEIVIQAKWKRRAMLTPCFVATFYTAPQHFLYSQYQGENEYGKPIFEYIPLFNFIDLLIIDEAGQVTPEVSIPVFSLAQKAFVVGDLKQIEPIWSIPPKIDVGNLTTLRVIDNMSQNEYLNDRGYLASSGSIMKMAQNACEFETDLTTHTENGLILLEHRRCNDEIIGFCNELAYGGILKPMKGKAKEGQPFPSMMAYHIEGVSERKYNSRCNINEVKAIITWLQQNKEAIKQAYNVENIEETLGIITPFASQKGELSKALADAGYKTNKIKLGTVHALQGAEREIILFSSVYSNEDEGTMFFDRDNKPNMLNVAVSRAKESFILFGDTRIFDESQDTPSGVLRRHLNIHEMVS